jgi:acetoin utilization protein AcuB
VQVREAMSRRVATVTPGTDVLTALRLLRNKGIRHLPVVEDGALVGIVSDRDLKPASRDHDLARRLVRDVMTTTVRWARPDDDLIAAARQMLAWKISALPVVEHQRVVGIVTTTDCLETMLIEWERRSPAPGERRAGAEA